MQFLYSGIVPTSICWQLVAIVSEKCADHQHQYIEIVAGARE